MFMCWIWKNCTIRTLRMMNYHITFWNACLDLKYISIVCCLKVCNQITGTTMVYGNNRRIVNPPRTVDPCHRLNVHQIFLSGEQWRALRSVVPLTDRSAHPWFQIQRPKKWVLRPTEGSTGNRPTTNRRYPLWVAKPATVWIFIFLV